MTSNLLRFVLGAGICTASLLATAAPLHRADVAADPAWLLHLDCDALRPTTIGKYILSEMDKPENKEKIAGFQSMFQFDPRTQLHAITLYGNSAKPGDGVLMVYADFDPDHLVTLAEGAKDYESSTHGKYTIHSWIDDKKKARNGVEPRVFAAIQGKHVIFGQREEAVAHALDVAADKASSMAGSHAFPEFGAPGDAHVVEAAARKMDLPESGPHAAILKMSKSVQLVMGESQKQFNGSFTLVADSAEVSDHVLSIAQGLLALAKLQNDRPDSVKVVNAIQLKQDGDRVVGTLALPASEVVDMMKADAARKARAGKNDE